MTNFVNGEKLLEWAEVKNQDVNRYYDKKLWNGVVRTAQEVIELSLKALLKMMGIDYPKEHDVGKIFEDVVKQKGLEIDKTLLNEIRSISAWLTNERAPAFYYEKEYTEEKAKKAKAYANKVLNFARGFKKVLALRKGKAKKMRKRLGE